MSFERARTSGVTLDAVTAEPTRASLHSVFARQHRANGQRWLRHLAVQRDTGWFT